MTDMTPKPTCSIEGCGGRRYANESTRRSTTMTDVQQARIEAAAKAMWEWSPREGDPTWADLDYGIKGIWRKDAAAALQAADAVVAVEMIVDELAGHPIGTGYY